MTECDDELTVTASLSDKKIRLDPQFKESGSENYFMLIKFGILKELISLIGTCPDCESDDLVFSDSDNNRMGLAHNLLLCCCQCDWKYSCYTSDYCADDCGKFISKEGINLK